ncbi:MAG: energy-coupling factor transporter transmembrane component T [Carboxydocellales bacterium]
MDVAFIDNLAVNGQGPMHRSGAWSKLIMLAIILVGAIFTKAWQPLLTMAGLLVVLILVEKLPLVKLLPFLGYPLFFALIFAVMAQGWSLASIVIILRSLTAGLVLILVLATTPYGELFRVIGKFLPDLVTDGLIMTYRCFFLLVSQMTNRLKAMHIRGGYGGVGLWKNLTRVAGSLGLVFIHSWEMAERMYNIMALRGYEGKLGLRIETKKFSRDDLWPIFWGIIFGGVVIGL